MSDSRISLRPLTPADLPLITLWFEDPDTGRFLGGPEWPGQMLALAGRSAGTMFRGARQIDSHHYLALAGGTPAGYIDCGTFDRCTVYGGEGPEGPIIVETIDAVTGAIAFVIAPELRRHGLGRAMIAAMLARSELRDVELFEAGVEPQNTASRRCLEAAGFALGSERPDVEGMLYYRVWRRALPSAE
ncbi:MAG: GNAT family N-acetyltransferase [Solirubrobacteraceae bacterium]